MDDGVGGNGLDDGVSNGLDDGVSNGLDDGVGYGLDDGVGGNGLDDGDYGINNNSNNDSIGINNNSGNDDEDVSDKENSTDMREIDVKEKRKVELFVEIGSLPPGKYSDGPGVYPISPWKESGPYASL